MSSRLPSPSARKPRHLRFLSRWHLVCKHCHTLHFATILCPFAELMGGSGMVRTQTDVLLLPHDELTLALSAEVVGRELDWADSVSSALAELVQALRQHTALAECTDGIYSKVDLTR